MLHLRVANYPPGGTMAPHFHEEPSLIVVVGGDYSEYIQASETQHGSGHMLFYPAFARHSQRFGSAGACKIIFTPQASSLEYLQDHGVSLQTARYVQAPTISQLASRLMGEIRNNDIFAPLATEGILLELVAAFARRERNDGPTTPPLWVLAARDLIRETADQNPSLESIAGQTGKHPVHLAKEFRRYFGTTIGAYRRQLRLQQAETMLLRKNIDLTEVALACGFAHQSHLCRSFKAAYGVTPSQFRAQRLSS